MKISEAKHILAKEEALGRTPKGRPISEYGMNSLVATREDDKNHEMDVIECLGCGFVISSLLVMEGCPNCGALDMTENITAE